MPDISTVHNDVALTNVSVAYRNPMLAASLLAPEVLVRRQSNKYFVYDPQRETARQTRDDRAPGAEANEIDFALSSDSYFCGDHALESVIPDEERDNADSPLAPDVDRTEFLTEKILLNQEIGLAELLRTAPEIPGVTLAGNDQWSDSANSDPADDIETARDAIAGATQTVPNTLILPPAVYQKLRHHPKIAERVKYIRLGIPGPAELAEFFDVERVIVPRAMVNTAARGQAPVLEDVWGKDAFLLSVPSRPGLKSIAPVLTFVWARAEGSLQGTSVQTWREERRKSTMIRVQKYYDQKLVAPAAAYAIRSAVA
ncbi:MAG: major capsid protein [Sumerlaeia bacterium]